LSPELAALSNKSYGSRYKKLWLLSAGIKGSRCAERWLSTCGTVAQLRSEYSNLELAGILHTGTSRKDNEFIIVQVGGLKIAFLSFTESTNYLDHGFLLESESVGMLNLLCPQDFFERENNHGAIKMALHRGIRSLISLERLMEIKKRIGRIHNVAYCDDLPIEKINELTPYQEKIEKMIRSAKQKADFVVICPHMGGQFNDKPGSFSEFYMEFFSSHHADLVIGNHPHIIQKMDWLEGTPVFYSLGIYL
jgi:hypothetical protein